MYSQDVAHAARLVALESICLSLLRSSEHDGQPITGLSIEATQHSDQVVIDLQFRQGPYVVAGEAV